MRFFFYNKMVTEIYKPFFFNLACREIYKSAKQDVYKNLMKKDFIFEL
jgi:hypothetical protein